MKWRSSESHWGAVSKAAHWLTAVLLLIALAVILYGMNLDRSGDRELWAPLYRASVYRHEAFGILALATIALRLIWRVIDRRPTFPATMRPWEMIATTVVHGALYGLAVCACILGWFQVSSNGADVNIFGWTPLPRLMEKDEHVHEVIAFWHEWVSWTFVAVVVLHVAAALKHHFIDRDRVLRDMLPSRGRVIVGTIVLLLAVAAFVHGAAARDLVIANITVIDGTGGPAQPNATVLVHDQRIVAVGNARVPAGAQRIDGRGKFLIPGLIDTHVHLFGGGAWANLSRPYKQPIDWDAARSVLHGYLYLGVTSVFDCGNNPDFIYPLRAQERAGEIVAPRIFATGQLLTYKGSWAEGYAGIPTPDWPDTIALLDKKIAEHPDLQKITLERRGAGPDALVPSLPVPLMQKMVAYLHDHGVRAAVHISTEDLAQAAVDAGIDVLAHPVGTARQTEAFTRIVGAKHMPVSTTLAVFDDIVRLGEDSRYLDQPPFSDVLPRDEIAARREKGAPRYVTLDWPRWYKAVLPYAQENVRRLHQAGAMIAMGSDRSDGPFSHRELELIVASGISPAETIRIATLNGAIFLGRDKDLGSIAPGKLADLVLLDADPTADIANARKIAAVIKNGAVIDRRALDLPINKSTRGGAAEPHL